MAQLHMEIR
nr:unnamed protein product [Callosobruchus analis]